MSPLRVFLSVFGRVCLAVIFLMSAIANKIPNFQKVAEMMGSKGVPMPQFLLAGAIVFLIVGSVSIILGYRARWGATLLLIFLLGATYYFHAFWLIKDPQAMQMEMGNFMKNLALMGAMMIIMANGTGAGSLDNRPNLVPLPVK